ncbi:MAG: T9SS type A sorting domain-containing protein [Flavobacteriales bacterium]|nr:T9SS type A sorting domain-containing protein [Flavobacteriales bacterium]
MQTINKIILALTLLMLTSYTFAQQKIWTTPPKKWNMTTSTPTSTSLPGGASTYSVANGAYDEAGNLLFYIQDNSVVDASGSSVGNLPNYYPNSDCSEAYEILGGEIAIVPIPGTCNEFYVIYSKDNAVGYSPLLYVEVDCSGASPSITYNGKVYTGCSGYVNQAFTIANHGGSDNTAFAVSKVYTGTGASAKRFLLSVSSTGIVRSEISSSGISSGTTTTYTTLGLTAYTDFNGIEAEISWGSNYFAWSSANGKVFTIEIDPLDGSYINPSTETYSISGAKGIEFSNSTNNPYLYVAAASDLKRIYTYNQSTTNISWGTNDLSNTFLEYGKNGRIYGVSPIYSGSTLTGSKLVGIVGTTVITDITADIDSRHVIGNNTIDGIFTLPNQIDGEDYTYFNGLPKVTIAGFTLNSNAVSNVCDNGTDKYCQNAAIAFNATYNNGTPAQYNLMIQAYNDNTCAPTQLTGSGYINYQSGWVSGTPTANLDLRTLSDGNSLNLGNITGTVKITYSIKDACGTESTYARYIQIYDPVPLSIDLGIKTPSGWTTPSHSIGSPVNVGSASLAYRVDNSTGTLSQLTVLIEEVDNTGAFIQTIYNKTINTSNFSLYDDVNLNTLCVGSAVWGFNPGFGSCTGGYTGYFSYTNGQNSYQNYYKITVTLSNLCGTSSDYSYLYVSSQGNSPVNPNVTERKQQEVIKQETNSLNIYPNPVTNLLTIEFDQLTDDAVEISLTDVLGKQTTVLMPSTNIKKGGFKQTFDVSKLPAGIYSYQIKTNKTIQTGMITKN